VLDAIFDYIKTSVIKAGVAFILKLLNPASAFFAACKAIYEIVKFLIERGSQIVELINAVINSVAAIVKGDTAEASRRVEGALAKAIPVAIGFLASLLDIGDPAATVRSIIEKARALVDRAIDAVINLAVKGLKAAGRFIAGVFTGKDKPAEARREKDPAVDPGVFIFEEAEGSHTIRVTSNLEVLRFSTPTHVTGSTAQKAQQAALESVSPRKPLDYKTDSLNRASLSTGHIPFLRTSDDRPSVYVPAKTPGYEPKDHAGHLVGYRFGGADTLNNVVPMHQVLNLSTFKVYENKLAEKYTELVKQDKAALLFMSIKPEFSRDDPMDGRSFRPDAVEGTSTLETLAAGAAKPTPHQETISSGRLVNPTAGLTEIKVNKLDVIALRGVGLSADLAEAIVAERTKSSGTGQFANYYTFDGLQLRLVPILGRKAELLTELNGLQDRLNFERA
jgi:hypothetical protein